MNHYRIEDDPDMTNPQTALQMWESQLAALKPTEALEQRAANARQVLAEIQQYANNAQMPQLAADAQAIWKLIAGLLKALRARDAALQGAKFVATAERSARLSVTGELETLRGALHSQDVTHPVVNSLMAFLYGEVADGIVQNMTDVLQNSLDAAGLSDDVAGAGELLALLENVDLYPESHDFVRSLLVMAREEGDA